MKTHIKLSVLAPLLVALLALAVTSTLAVLPLTTGVATSAYSTYPFIIGAADDDHTNLLLSFAQGVALPSPEPPALTHLNTGPSPAQTTVMPAADSGDTARTITGLVSLALRLLIVGGLVLFLRSRRHTGTT